MSKQKIDKDFIESLKENSLKLVVNEDGSSNILGKAEKMFKELEND